MAVFPTQVFTKDNIYIRWGQRYISDGFNKKSLGFPKGVYKGFIPEVDGSDPFNLVNLKVDPSENYSLLRVRSSTSVHLMDIFTESVVQLNFSGHVDFPVFVVAKASYQIGSETSGQILTQTVPANGIDEVNICVVTKPGSLVVDFDDVPSERHEPTAYATQDFGFMPGGALEDLDAAIITTSDVDDSKTDTVAFTHPSLKDRLTADFSIDRIAGRQSKEIVNLRANELVGVVGSSINISHSFSFKGRDHEPKIDILGGGSESIIGAIAEVTSSITTTTSDTDRNIVAVQDAATRRPFVDESTGAPVFGRLKFDEVSMSGTLTFSSSIVVLTSDDLTATVEAGDIIEDLDGNYYPVDAVSSSDITLSTLYVGTTGTSSAGALKRRRFNVDLFTRDDAGSENSYTILRRVALNPGTWSANGVLGPNSPDIIETFTTSGGESGDIMRQTFSPADELLYRPDPGSDPIDTGVTITGGTGGSTVDSIITLPAPNLIFYTPVFLQIDNSRSDQMHIARQAPQLLLPRASEIIDGLTRYAPDQGTDRFTAIQGNDSRVPTPDENDALVGTDGTPSAINRYITDSDSRVFTPITYSARQTGNSSGTGDRIIFTTSPILNDGAWTHSASTGVFELQAGFEGRYQISAAVSIFTTTIVAIIFDPFGIGQILATCGIAHGSAGGSDGTYPIFTSKEFASGDQFVVEVISTTLGSPISGTNGSIIIQKVKE